MEKNEKGLMNSVFFFFQFQQCTLQYCKMMSYEDDTQVHLSLCLTQIEKIMLISGECPTMLRLSSK